MIISSLPGEAVLEAGTWLAKARSSKWPRPLRGLSGQDKPAKELRSPIVHIAPVIYIKFHSNTFINGQVISKSNVPREAVL
jgi:hypothetical protein